MTPSSAPKYVVYGLCGVAALVAVVWVYKMFSPSKPVAPVYAPAAPAKGMENTPTHTVSTVPVRAFDKSVAVKKMALPVDVASSPTKEVVSTAKIPSSGGGYTTATVLDTSTGVVETIVREDPRPLIGFGGKTELGIRGGLTTQGTEGSLYVRQDVLRVGGVYLSGYAEVGGGQTHAGAKGMVDISYRW